MGTSKQNLLRQANRNIHLYVFTKVFTKRVFLPLAAIYFVDRYGFTVKEIGLLAMVFAITQLLAEVPTGYFADRVARVSSIRIGAVLNMISTLLYVFTPFKAGIFIAIIIEAIGYSFLGGAGEALIHDSLEVRGDTKNYSKVVSRAQSISLIINAVLVALVPMTYQIDQRLPFLIGTFAYGALFLLALSMNDVVRHAAKRKLKRPSLSALRNSKTLIAFAILFGIVGALFTAPSDIINLALRDFGMRAEMIGWWYAGGSLLGAFVGLFIYRLRDLRFRSYITFDSFMMLMPFAAALTRSYILLGTTMLISMAFWRYRRIIYQDHLLTIYPTKYKATILSAMANADQLQSIWIPVAVAFAVSTYGYSIGLGLTGLAALAIVPPFIYIGARLAGDKT